MMKRLSEYKGDEALELLADLIDPVLEIMSDGEVKARLTSGFMAAAVKPILKNHRKAAIEILARLNGMAADDYLKCVNLITIPKVLLELISDPDLVSLFTSAEQTDGVTSSVSASENTEE